MDQLFDEFELCQYNSKPLNWCYIAEGNANLIISLTPSATVVSNLIIRLRKHANNSTNNDDYDLKIIIDYLNIMATLIGKEFAVPSKSVKIKIQNYEEFNNCLLTNRPAFRLNKGVYNCNTAILSVNANFLPTYLISADQTDCYTIEIKPKQGWTLEKWKKCRYCLLQYLKLENKKINGISDYCPIDLFSGSKASMEKAIKALIKNPQNNFQLFKNGELIYGSEKKLEIDFLLRLIQFNKIENLIELILNILICPYNGNKNVIDEISTTAASPLKSAKAITKITNELPIGCVLQKILHLQLFVKIGLLKFLTEKQQNDLELNSFFPPSSTSVIHHKNIVDKVNQNTVNKELNEIILHENLTILEKYLIGATALDCSILLTFQRCYENIEEISDIKKKHLITISGDQHFISKVTVVDLDPKNISHFSKYIKQYEESLLAYQRYITNMNK